MANRDRWRGGAMVWRHRSRHDGRARWSARGLTLVLVTLGLCALGSAQAVAGEPSPEPAPRGETLRPEPAPLAATRRAPVQRSLSSSQRLTPSSTSTSQGATARPSEERVALAPAQQPRSVTAAPKSSPAARRKRASPRKTAKLKPRTLPREVYQAQNRIAAPASTTTAANSPDSRLMLAGGLLLIALVLGDAAFLMRSGRLALSGRDDE
jgi:hypothetical protein